MAITYTANYNLPLPDFDRTPWHEYYWSAIKTIDAVMANYVSGIPIAGVWTNSTAYTDGDFVVDGTTGVIWECEVSHTSHASNTFTQDRSDNPTYWTNYIMEGISSYGRSLLDDADAATARGTLGSTTIGDSLFTVADAATARGILELATSSTDDAITRFDGTTGKTQDSLVIIDDSGNLTGVGTINGVTRSNFIGMQVFTSSGTYTRSTGCTKATVLVVGGGGGGGGANTTLNACGGGGGAGGWALKVVTPGATETVTVGSAGAAGGGGASGGTGGTTSFGTHCSATGGSGGTGSTTAASVLGGTGGTGSDGDVNGTGGAGHIGSANAAAPGNGGAGYFGGGGRATTSAGEAGSAAGAGGGGGRRDASGANGGGAGAAGICIAWEYG